MMHNKPISDELLGRASWTHDVGLIFLVGCPRSGTTWLQAMLAAHPAIYTGPETHFFSAFSQADFVFQGIQDRKVGLDSYLEKKKFYKIMKELFWSTISALPEPSPKPQYFLEKTPDHSQFAQFILNIFPKARFIHLIRDGRAVVSSLLRVARSWGERWAPQNVVLATRFWVNSVQVGRKVADLVTSKEQYIEIKYEALRSDTEANLSKLLAWINLSQDQSLIRSVVNANSLSNYEASGTLFSSIPEVPHQKQNTLPTYPNGFVGPAPVNRHEIQLSLIQRFWVESLAGTLLQELGYPVHAMRFPALEKVAANRYGFKLLQLLESRQITK